MDVAVVESLGPSCPYSLELLLYIKPKNLNRHLLAMDGKWHRKTSF